MHLRSEISVLAYDIFKKLKSQYGNPKMKLLRNICHFKTKLTLLQWLERQKARGAQVSGTAAKFPVWRRENIVIKS